MVHWREEVFNLFSSLPPYFVRWSVFVMCISSITSHLLWLSPDALSRLPGDGSGQS